MRSGSATRWLRLVNWYLNLFHVWAISVAVFFAYIYLYDRFRISLIGGHYPEPPGGIWFFLITSAWGLGEPLVTAVHAALVSAVLFSFEEGEGFSYVRHSFGVGRAPVYLAKIAAGLLLVSTPLAASKVFMAVVWDYRLLTRFAEFLSASVAVYAAAAFLSLYLISFYSFWALVVGRPVYFLVGAFLEAYLMETLFGGLLMLIPISFTVFQPFGPAAAIQRYGDRFAIALVHACAAFALQLRGEVRWK